MVVLVVIIGSSFGTIVSFVSVCLVWSEDSIVFGCWCWWFHVVVVVVMMEDDDDVVVPMGTPISTNRGRPFIWSERM